METVTRVSSTRPFFPIRAWTITVPEMSLVRAHSG